MAGEKTASPEDPIAPTITPEEEAAMLPIPKAKPSFLRHNALPLLLSEGVLIFGTIGMLLLISNP